MKTLNLETLKMDMAFKPTAEYWDSLSDQIQQHVGIEVERLEDNQPQAKIELKPKAAPLQLTVEFGFPLTAEKNDSDTKEIENLAETQVEDRIESVESDIHIEPLEIQPNPKPYWHDFTPEENPEGIFTDENDTEYSSIVISPDGSMDLDKQIFHEEIRSEEVRSEEVRSEDVRGEDVFAEDLDALHDQMEAAAMQSSEINSISNTELNSEVESNTEIEATTEVISTEFHETIAPANEVKTEELMTPPSEIIADVELAFPSDELDSLHEQMTGEVETKSQYQPTFTKYQPSATARVATSEIEPPAQPSKRIEIKPNWTDFIPWSTIFGIVASLMAVASAYFIWNSIQKPIAIDEYIDQTIAPKVSNSVITPNTQTTAQVEINLPPADFIAADILDNVSENSSTTNFKNLSERSKISAVELEKAGLTVLNVEDEIFNSTNSGF